MPFQTSTIEEFNAIEARVSALEALVKKMSVSPLYLEWVTLEQAAKLLNLKAKQTVSKMCKAGTLHYKKDARKMEVSYRSIIAYNQRSTIC